MKPEKFQAKQEDMMASMRKRGLPAISLLQGFSGPHVGEVDTSSTLHTLILHTLEELREIGGKTK